jgi:hypothetical protein
MAVHLLVYPMLRWIQAPTPARRASASDAPANKKGVLATPLPTVVGELSSTPSG